MDIKERIQLYLDYKGINTNQFETSIGVSRSYWRKTKSVSANVVMDICRIYTDLNLDWLFREEGGMLKSNEAEKVNSVSKKYDAEVEIDNEGYLKIKIKK